MKIWIDDVRKAPEGYKWIKSVNKAKQEIEMFEIHSEFVQRKSGGDIIPKVEVIDLDHDAGDYAKDGGDYIELLNWLEETGRNYPLHFHSANPVGVENMRRILIKNDWAEV